MKYLKLSFWLLLAALQKPVAGDIAVVHDKILKDSPVYLQELYNSLFIDEIKPAFHAFTIGVEGMMQIQEDGILKNDSILTIIDYSQPSTVRRLWVVDIKNKEVLHNALVAHGKNSGLVIPTQFSNRPNSNMSSSGFFVTGETYSGKHGYSLRIDGIEPGINDKARERAIVIHSASYATMEFVKQNGRLGRSFGCPALPPAKSPNIINTIKGESCLFIYAPDKQYALKSKIVKQQLKI